jgi:hypothetical protein
MVIVDHFTKFTQFYPLENTKAESLAKVIVDEWCCKYGIPETILTDGGKNYQSKVLDMVYEHLDIKRCKTTPFHPQADGQSERMIRTMKSMIKSYVDENQTNWDEHLAKYAFAYNTAVNATTQQTPFEMWFARRPRIPIDIVYPSPEELGRAKVLATRKEMTEHGEVIVLMDEEPKVQLDQSAQRYLLETKEKLAECFASLEQNRTEQMDKAKWRHDRNIKKHSYQVGDKVLTDHPQLKQGLAQGLAKKYYGPYTIVGVNANGCDYLIKLVGKPKSRIKQIHKNRLKTYYEMGRPNIDTISYKDKATQAKITATTAEKVVDKYKKIAKTRQKARTDEDKKKANRKTVVKRAYKKNPLVARWAKNKETKERREGSRRSPRLASKL